MRESGNTKSGLPRNSFEWIFQPLWPLRISIERTRHSVERFPLDRIARILADRNSLGFAKGGSDRFTYSMKIDVDGSRGLARSLKPSGTNVKGFIESSRSSI